MAPTEIPTVCRAAVCHNKGPNNELKITEEYPVPKPGKGELLLKLTATGLCLSDWHFMQDDWGFPTDPEVTVMGHEGAGVVVALGEGVDPNEWKVGDRAGIKPMYSACGKCRSCRRGLESNCSKAIPYGSHKNGSFSQYAISFADYTTRIPDGLSDEMAAPIMCSGGTTYAAVKTSGAKAGQWMVIPGGGGGVGSMAVQYAKALGIRVIVIDSGEKEEMCKTLGAEQFIDFRTCPDVHAEVHKITGGGADAVLVTGGTKGAYENAHRMLCVGGTQVCVGMPSATSGAIAGGHPNELIAFGLTVKGSLVAGMQDLDEALDFAARGAIKLENLKTHPFKDFPELMKKLGEGKIVGRSVVLYDD